MKTLLIIALLLALATPALALQATVTWVNPVDPNRTGIRVERQDGGAGAFVVQGSVAADVATFNQTGLVTGTQYCYRIVAVGPLGDAPAPNPTGCVNPAGVLNVNGPITITVTP